MDPNAERIPTEGYPIYREPPVRLTAGRYVIPAGHGSFFEAGVQAQKEDAEKPRFRGWIQGIFVGRDPDWDEVENLPCPKEEVKSLGDPLDEHVLKESPYWFDPPYLPPGTLDMTYPSGGACGSKPAFSVYREFLVDGGADLSIARVPGRYFAYDFSTDRVTAGTIGGLPAVIIPPFTPEGYGDSNIVVREPSGGTLQIRAIDLTLAELRKIAEALMAEIS